jgi:hypothetical protein
MESLRTTGKIIGGVIGVRLGLHGVGLLYNDCKKVVGFFKSKEEVKTEQTEIKTDDKKAS